MSTPALPLALLGLVLPEATYPTLEAVKAALQAHARRNRYAITVKSADSRRGFYMYSKSSKYDSKGKNLDTHETKRRKNTSTMKTDYPYRAVARKDDVSGQFILTIIDNNHNHGPVLAASVFL